MRNLAGYVYIGITILLTVYGQVVVKWQVSRAGALPEGGGDMTMFLFRLVLNPWVLSGFAAAFLAAVFWIAVLTKFQLSYAYPFVALTFVFVVAAGGLLFGEPITAPKLFGLALIVAGIALASQG
jgi:multidrug transporter EmrE-like cation transporter